MSNLYLALRTDAPRAELYLLQGENTLSSDTWHAHRELSNTLLKRIDTLLMKQNKKIQDIRGLIVFEGPGSFTGLRIGIATVNALGYGLSVPVVGAHGDNWLLDGGKLLSSGHDQESSQGGVRPMYGAPVHITQPRK